MKQCLVVFVLGLCGMVGTTAVYAQESSSRDSVKSWLKESKKENPKVSFLRCAPLFGRGGIAFGETGYCEANVASWFGVGVLVGRSGVTGYRDQGANTNMHDFSSGLVFVVRLPKEIKRFRFGIFGQAVYAGSHIKSTYQDSYTDPETGNVVPVQEIYQESDRDPIVTIGANIEYRIPHGMPVLIRVGRNLGDGLSAKTGGGFYFAAGPMFDPVRITRSVGHLISH